MASLAQANAAKPFPWGGDYSTAKSVSCRFGANVDQGLRQSGGDNFSIVNGLTDSCASTLVNGRISNMHMFRANTSFVASNAKALDITVVVRRLDQAKPAKIHIYFYESAGGYKPPTDPWWEIPAGEQWQEHTWKVSDANFVGQWGYNIAVETPSPGGLLLKEIRVTKAGAP